MSRCRLVVGGGWCVVSRRRASNMPEQACPRIRDHVLARVCVCAWTIDACCCRRRRRTARLHVNFGHFCREVRVMCAVLEALVRGSSLCGFSKRWVYFYTRILGRCACCVEVYLELKYRLVFPWDLGLCTHTQASFPFATKNVNLHLCGVLT